MIYDLQKASILKRISAFLLDFILICILATGFVALVMWISQFDDCYNDFVALEESFQEHGITSATITQEEYEALSAEAKQFYDDNIEEARYLLSNCVTRAFLSISISLFLTHLLLEFVVPLLLKNGQTVGKKVFGIGLMQVSGVKVKPVALFVRAMLGKYAVETMVPLSTALIFFFLEPNVMLLILFFALYVVEIIVFFASKNYSFIHDVMASTVNVDMKTQMIFNSTEEMIAYKEELHKQESENAEYK